MLAVTAFKTDTAQPEIMDASDGYDVDVITCAAPNLRVQNQSGEEWNTMKIKRYVPEKSQEVKLMTH